MLIIALGILLTGCKQEPPDSTTGTITVWTDTSSYSEYSARFPTLTLDTGTYGRLEITDSEWDSIKQFLTNEDKYNWTEDQIYNWFIGAGFSDTLAHQEKEWLMSINHGFIAIRDDNIVYLILK